EEEGTRPSGRMRPALRVSIICLELRASARCASVAFGLGAVVLLAGPARHDPRYSFLGSRTKREANPLAARPAPRRGVARPHSLEPLPPGLRDAGRIPRPKPLRAWGWGGRRRAPGYIRGADRVIGSAQSCARGPAPSPRLPSGRRSPCALGRSSFVR